MKHKLCLGIDPLEAEELLKPIRTKFKRRRVFVFNIDDIWSADLKDMQSFSKQNNGVKYWLTVIDLYSKYAYTIPLKSMNAEVIIEAFQTFFKTKNPNKLWKDQGVWVH